MASVLGRFWFLNHALSRMERDVFSAWIEAVNATRAAVTWTRISDDLESGNVEAVAQALLTRSILTGVIEQVRATYLAGADTIVSSVPKSAKNPRGVGRLLFRFDVTSPDAERWLAKQSSEFITRVSREQREAVRVMLQYGMRVGQNPRQTAIDIVGRINKQTGRRTGGIIGLSRPQTRALTRAKAELASGDPALMRKYLRRKRRDKNLDGIVKRAIKDKKKLSAAQVNKLSGRYSDKLLTLRAETIARTESHQAFNAGRREAWEQLRGQAGLQDEHMVRKWDATMDKVTRSDHKIMHGQARTGDEPFKAPDGSLMMHPGDTSLNADPAQIINCRCMEILEVDFVAAEAQRNVT